MRRSLRFSALLVAALAVGGLAACQGCHAGHTEPALAGIDGSSATKPTLRLYVMSTVAGALEPCGCSKDQLGGVDHLAAYIAKEGASAPASLVLGAGPMLFLDPKLRPGDSTQDAWKGDALARSMKDIGLAAWAPGANDWAAGADKLASYRDETGAQLLAANITGLGSTFVRDVNGVKVGVVGVSDPRDKEGRYPDGVKPTAAFDALQQGVAELKKQGAQVLIGLVALPRGEALRVADKLSDFHVLVVGKPIEAGDANDGAKLPVLAGNTLVVETANHLQTTAVIDLFVRPGASGPIVFADAGGVSRAEEIQSLAGRIRELETRINSWELDHTVKAEDLAARKADLEKLRAEKAAKEAAQASAGDPKGSFFRYTNVEVRDKLGRDKAVADEIGSYYKRVNDHNKVAFASRVPAPVEAGQAGYVGVEACTNCHDDARKVWDKTAHATAYPTLQKDAKEFNLDCVSCHVTGYDKPGGSTVTHNEKLQNVQCETCHGPGSLHAKNPGKKGLITAAPKADLCLSCHHPPHVEGFDANEKMKLVLGPGHGRPKN